MSRLTGEVRGPVGYLARHPAARALSILGASGAATVFAMRARRAQGGRRLGWLALCLLEVAIAAGIGLSTREGHARRGRTGAA